MLHAYNSIKCKWKLIRFVRCWWTAVKSKGKWCAQKRRRCNLMTFCLLLTAIKLYAIHPAKDFRGKKCAKSTNIFALKLEYFDKIHPIIFISYIVYIIAYLRPMANRTITPTNNLHTVNKKYTNKSNALIFYLYLIYFPIYEI